MRHRSTQPPPRSAQSPAPAPPANNHAAPTSAASQPRDATPQHRQQPQAADAENCGYPQSPKSDGRLAGRYFGRSEPRNRGCGGENVKKSPRDRLLGGATCYNPVTASKDRFQALPKWEISEKSASKPRDGVASLRLWCSRNSRTDSPPRGWSRTLLSGGFQTWTNLRQLRETCDGRRPTCH